MRSDEDVRGLLDFDPLAEAERITGESYKSHESTMLLGLALQFEKSARAREAMEAADDTAFTNTLERYLRIAGEEGFEEALRLPFKRDDGREETLFVLFHPVDAILLVFDTYCGDSVNGGKFYYNWRPAPERERSSGDGVLSSGSFDGTDTWAGDHDCREALRLNIRRLREAGQFVTPWVRQPFLWLLHHGDEHTEGYDYRAINAERVAMLPENVRLVIAAEAERSNRSRE